jgi:putative transposase
MARIARIVAPGMPHHITQRGNRRQQTFFTDDDYQQYLTLLSALQEQEMGLFYRHERTGRPLGTDVFIEKIETLTNRVLFKQKPGPKRSKNNT